MEVVIGLIGLLMAAAGFMEVLASLGSAAQGSPIVGVILFAGGVAAFALSLILNQLKRLRWEMQQGFEKRSAG